MFIKRIIHTLCTYSLYVKKDGRMSVSKSNAYNYTCVVLVRMVPPFSHQTVAVGIPYPTHVSRIVVVMDIIAFDDSKIISAGSKNYVKIKLSITVITLLSIHTLQFAFALKKGEKKSL